jgi:hypothetical protein
MVEGWVLLFPRNKLGFYGLPLIPFLIIPVFPSFSGLVEVLFRKAPMTSLQKQPLDSVKVGHLML